MQTIGEFGEDAGSGDFLFFRQDHFVSPLDLAFVHATEGFDHNRDLDCAGGADAFVRIQRISFTGVEILGEKTDFAFEGSDEWFYLIVEFWL